MAGHHKQDQNPNPKREPGLWEMIKGANRQITLDKLGGKIVESDAQREHHHRVANRREKMHRAVDSGKLDEPYISPIDVHRWKSVGWLIIIAAIVLLCAFVLSGTAGRVLNSMKPEPTPMYVENPNMPGTYIQVFPTAVETQAAATEALTQEAEAQSTPVVLNFQPVPAPTSGQYFVVPVASFGKFGKNGYWSSVTSTGDYYSFLMTGSCGTNIVLPSDKEVYAFVDVNLQMYGPEITATETGVNIACDGYNNTITFAVRVK